MLPPYTVNGTTYIPRSQVDDFRLPEASRQRWILARLTVSNYVLAPAPKHAQIQQPPVRPEVAASLEHSLNEHAEVWAELSKL